MTTDPIPRMPVENPFAANIAALKSLFPAAVADDRIDFDILRQLLGDAVEEGDERYGLHWNGKRAARAFALTPATGTLRPDRDDGPDWDTTRNMVIEGDNLEVLKLLRRAYAGRVKLIYIDPPYNTGNDFVYPDDYRDTLGSYARLTGQRDGDGMALTSNGEGGGRFHTNWLNMMYPRLLLARDMLRDDGVILISIDDNELANLRLLMDEVFGAGNFVAVLVWEKTRKNDARLVSRGHDYIVAFARSRDTLHRQDIRWREAKPGAAEVQQEYRRLRTMFGDDDRAIERELARFYAGLHKTHPAKGLSRYKRVDRRGVWRDDNMSWPGGGGPSYDVLHPVTGLACAVPEGGWRYGSPDRMQEMIAAGRVEFRADHHEPPIRKTYLVSTSDTADPDDSDTAGQVAGSYFYRSAIQATNLMNDLFDGQQVFDSPKDIDVLSRWIAYAGGGSSDAIILDFFAGSGTTGHAVMALNAADGGSRRYVLVQLPEPLGPDTPSQRTAAALCDRLGKPRTIAELTKERLRRAGAKLRAAHPDTAIDTGFRVYRLAPSNLKPWDPAPADLVAAVEAAVDNILPGRSEDDLLVELMLRTGVDPVTPVATRIIAGVAVHAVDGGVLIACMAAIGANAEGLGEGIAAWHAELAPPRATAFHFRDSGFADAAAKANLAAILRQRVGTAGIARLSAL